MTTLHTEQCRAADPAIRAKSTVALAHPVKGGWHRIRLWCSGILDRNANLPEYYLVLSAQADTGKELDIFSKLNAPLPFAETI